MLLPTPRPSPHPVMLARVLSCMVGETVRWCWEKLRRGCTVAWCRWPGRSLGSCPKYEDMLTSEMACQEERTLPERLLLHQPQSLSQPFKLRRCRCHRRRRRRRSLVRRRRLVFVVLRHRHDDNLAPEELETLLVGESVAHTPPPLQSL